MDRLTPWGLALAAALLAAPSATFAQADPEDLADKYRCFICHNVEEKRVGPAFRDVARRYKDDAAAFEKLMTKVRRGGNGNWGKTSMPANDVNEADLRTLLRWVLGRA